MKQFKYLSMAAVLAVVAIAAGCNDDDDDGGPVVPTPSPTATATGSPSPTATVTSTPPASSVNVLAVQRSNSGGVAIRFNAAQPTNTIRTNITGLPPGINVLGIDRRPANGRVYLLASDRRLYELNTTSFTVTTTGTTLSVPPSGSGFGFDFNPVPDRIRVVSNEELNLRLNPDTGAVVDSNPDVAGVQTDGRLAYAAGDVNAQRDPNIVAAAYTNSATPGATSTTNYAIDSRLGLLVTQGTRAGAANPVSPNTGQLFTVGGLGVVPMNRNSVSFDIGAQNAAFATIDNALYSINLSSGQAQRIGAIATGNSTEPIVGLVVLS